jgi:hypothetical protein
MSSRQKVLDQLDKATQAHRTAHHSAVREAREHRARLAAQASATPAVDVDIMPPDEAGMAAGDPAATLGDMGGL